MAYAPYILRPYSYQRQKTTGADTYVDPAKLDVELAALTAAYNALVQRERAYTTPAGALTQIPTLASLSLSSTTRFVATAAQTLFTVPTYNISTDYAEVWTGTTGGLTMVDPNSVVKTDTTHVTIPAQASGNIVVIMVFSSGAGVLATLSDTAFGTSGAGLIGLYGGGLFAATTVEAGLQEVMTLYNALVVSLGTISGIIRDDGTVPMQADFDANGYKVINLVPGTVAGDAVEYSQFATFATIWTTLQAYYAKLDGTTPWTGNWDAGNHQLKNLKAGVSSGDAVNVGQLLTGGVAAAVVNLIPNGAGEIANGVAYTATGAPGVYDYGKVDTCKGALIGTTVAGTLTQAAGSSVSDIGTAMRWTAVTLTGGTAAVRYRFFIEAKEAAKFTNGTLSFRCKILHTDSTTWSAQVVLSAATALDNFTAVTGFASSPQVSVASGVVTELKYEAIPVAAANYGIQVDIIIVPLSTMGGGLNFDLSEVQLQAGPIATVYAVEPIEVTVARLKRYYQVLLGTDTVSYLAAGFASTTQIVDAAGRLPVDMRTTPTLGATTSAAATFSVYDGNAATALNTMTLDAQSTSPQGFLLTCTMAAATLTRYRPHRLIGPAASRIELTARF